MFQPSIIVWLQTACISKLGWIGPEHWTQSVILLILLYKALFNLSYILLLFCYYPVDYAPQEWTCSKASFSQNWHSNLITETDKNK